MRHAPKSSDVGQNSDERHAPDEPPQVAGHAGDDGGKSGHHDTLWTLHDSHLALNAQTFGWGPHLTHHDGTYQGQECNDTCPDS